MNSDVASFQDTTINGDNVSEELEKQCSSYVFVGQQYNAAEAEYEQYKLRVKQLVAALDEQVRLAAAKGAKKITEAAITKEIERHPDYIKAMEHQITLYRRKEDLKILTWGWRDRKDLLIELAKDQRAEIKQLQYATVKEKMKVAA